MDKKGHLQVIYYGAPGTGKSHRTAVEVKAAETDGRVVRTTFHPDSDYSTFVGAYKPTMVNGNDGVSRIIYSIDELKRKFSEYKLEGMSYPCIRFGMKYWQSMKRLSQSQVKEMLADAGTRESLHVEMQKGIAVGQESAAQTSTERISYAFIPQAFLQAYVDAWMDLTKPEYLIIEEINRGNCAQIFGDLFQLLDRGDNGFSSYPIRADADLKRFLAKAFSDVEIPGHPKVKSGEELLLPPNLFIRATMNTSDQSLFPIDSAFKRRWDWKYVPIREAKDANYKIEVAGIRYSWWQFLEAINGKILETTDSADKQLGYFFCKPSDGIIDEDTLVGKVLFYLWNDVFKISEFADAVFNSGLKDGGGNERKIAFKDFYACTDDADDDAIASAMVRKFLSNLGLEPLPTAGDVNHAE